MILITGGCGFIGCNFILNWLASTEEPIINLDALTYAGKLENLATIEGNKQHHFVKGNILDRPLLDRLLETYKPRAIIHFAAESHVDRSIEGPGIFIKSNIEGTFNLLEGALAYWRNLTKASQESFRFLHVSTDEVYGSLTPFDEAFREENAYCPRSPYSASKAASDHLVSAWYHTFNLPTLITNCSNNFGPFQFPEKLIPLTIANALQKKPITVFGDGQAIRDWLYVIDHCKAIERVLEKGKVGERYNIGATNEMTNLSMINKICDLLDLMAPMGLASYKKLITFVKDRPGHDKRYAINPTKIKKELGWEPAFSFDNALKETIKWYLQASDWLFNLTKTESNYISINQFEEEPAYAP